MSLGSLFEAELQPPKSSIDEWAETLSEKDRADLLTYAAHTGLSHSAFHRILKAQGVTVGKEKATEWRRGHGFPRG